jgi:hypothetical protein
MSQEYHLCPLCNAEREPSWPECPLCGDGTVCVVAFNREDDDFWLRCVCCGWDSKPVSTPIEALRLWSGPIEADEKKRLINEIHSRITTEKAVIYNETRTPSQHKDMKIRDATESLEYWNGRLTSVMSL